MRNGHRHTAHFSFTVSLGVASTQVSVVYNIFKRGKAFFPSAYTRVSLGVDRFCSFPALKWLKWAVLWPGSMDIGIALLLEDFPHGDELKYLISWV